MIYPVDSAIQRLNNWGQEGSPTFDKVGWVGIIAIKTERTQIHFLSDILIVVASLDLKVPISSKLPVPLAPTRVQIY